MKKFDINIEASFWLPKNDEFPTIEIQLNELFMFAKMLQTIGIPLNSWFPPGDTPEESILNKAFTENGPTPAAIAICKTQFGKDKDFRSISVWNGEDNDSGVGFGTDYMSGSRPSSFDFNCRDVDIFKSKETVLKLVFSTLEIWRATKIEVAPYHYLADHKVFQDRPGVGWMIYLPLSITPAQVPEAEELIPILGENKQQKGTLLISTKETFDINNKEHIKRANAIEVRLVDQDLLPKRMDFLKIR